MTDLHAAALLYPVDLRCFSPWMRWLPALRNRIVPGIGSTVPGTCPPF
ncbi:hypothetical protein [Desulfobulbus elongatus]|nr:hypothetical protein [Desulfobulbus elongatus]